MHKNWGVNFKYPPGAYRCCSWNSRDAGHQKTLYLQMVRLKYLPELARIHLKIAGEFNTIRILLFSYQKPTLAVAQEAERVVC